MIIGIGFDVIEISRIQRAFERFGQRFADRCFTSEEWALAQSKAHPWRTLAKRFAAKEACAKALKTGVGQGIEWTHMETLTRPNGAPFLRLHKNAAEHLNQQIPSGRAPHIHVSLSDDESRAYAWVIVSAEPMDP